MTLLLVGIVFILIGCWTAFWGPAASRNSSFGLKFIFIGLTAIVFGILVIAMPSDIAHVGGRLFHRSSGSMNLSYMLSRRMGPIPFGLFLFAALLAVNGLGLRRGLKPRQMVGANIFTVACLVVLYALGPRIFTSW